MRKFNGSYIFKALTAMVLVLLLMFSTVATSFAVTVENAPAEAEAAEPQAEAPAVEAQADAAEVTPAPAVKLPDDSPELLAEKQLLAAENANASAALEREREDLVDSGWSTSDTWYVYNNVSTNGWSTGSPQMSSSDNNRYYVFYLKYDDLSSDSHQLRFRYYASGSNQTIGPGNGWYDQNATNNSNGNAGQVGPANNGNAYFYAPLNNNTVWQRVLVGANASGNYFWASVDDLTTDLSATVKAAGSTSAQTINEGSSITLTATAAGTFSSSTYSNSNGAASGYKAVYTYQYSTNGTSWTDIGSKVTVTGSGAGTDSTGVSFTPASDGTYYVRVIVNDGNVTAGTNAINDRYATSDNLTITVRNKNTITYNKGTAKTGGGTISGTTPSIQYYYNGGSAVTLAGNVFSSTGYTQDGWATSNGGSRTYAAGASYSTNADKTLYPAWTEKTSTLTVTTDGNGSISTSGTTSGVASYVTATAGSGNTGYAFSKWVVSGTNASHVRIKNTSGTQIFNGTSWTSGTDSNTSIRIYTDGSAASLSATVTATFVQSTRTVVVGKMLATDGTGYTTSAASAISPTLSGSGDVDIGSTFNPTTTNVSGYQFIGWITSSTSQTSAALNTTPTKTTLAYGSTTMAASTNLYYYALYKKIYYLTFYKSWVDDTVSGGFTYVTAPPRTVTVTRNGSTAATYTYAESSTATSESATKTSTGTYNEGDKLQVLAGDSIVATYSALASSDVIAGAFYNNSKRYTTSNENDNLYKNRVYSASGYATGGDDDWDYDYAVTTTLYADKNYYSGSAYTTINTNTSSYKGTISQSAHTVSWTVASDYLNIDLELAEKKQFVFSDYDNTVINHINTDDFYAIGETVSTGNTAATRLAVYAAGNADQTNTITYSNVKLYYYDATNKTYTNASGTPVSASARVEYTGLTKSYSSNTTIANSGATKSTAYVYFTGTMPATDLYVDLGLVVTYKMYLGSYMVSDTSGEAKTKFHQVASIYAKVNSSNVQSLAYNTSASTPTDPTSAYTATAGTQINYSYTMNSSWTNYYMFCGWYKGTSSAPDLVNGLISTKDTFTYKPTANTYVYAVGTRDLYINGSRYIIGGSTDWPSTNLKMNYDPGYYNSDTDKYGRYYWEITPTMFAAASSAYNKGDGYFESSGNYYWNNNSSVGNSAFQFYDTSEKSDSNKNYWRTMHSYVNNNDDVNYGMVYPRDTDDETTRKNKATGFIEFSESLKSGYSAPLYIYAYPGATGFSVNSTYVYNHLYVSNGFKNIDQTTPSNVTIKVNSGTARSNATTNESSFTSNLKFSGAGWNPSEEGHVSDVIIGAKEATVTIAKTVASSSYKVSSFIVYDLYSDSVKAYAPTSSSGTTYSLAIKMTTGHNLYICPVVESTSANMKVVVDATQLNKNQWGDLVGCYAWYSDGTKAYGNYPGQLMIPSDDGLSLSANFPATHGSGTLVGITFSNYVDGSNTWLGGDNVMGGSILPTYNTIGSGDYQKVNCKVQTYDYREPNAYYINRDTNAASFLMTFALKAGNSPSQAAMTSRHSELIGAKIPGSFTHTHSNGTSTSTLSFAKTDFEYLTTADGETYADMKGNEITGEPTASFYVVAKGQVTYSSGSLVRAFYSGNNYDTITGVTYPNTGSASGASVTQGYAVQWYVYDASGNYITNILSAGYADKTVTNTGVTLIANALTSAGYAVDGRSVAICYDSPRYCYNTLDSGTIYNGGTNFDAYRLAGQWYQQSAYQTAKVYAEVGMLTDNGEELAGTSTASYGSATVSINTTKLTYSSYGTTGTTDGVNWGQACIADGDKQAITLTASATNFAGWYYYNADDELTLATKSNTLSPTFSKDVTYYAMYEARATYAYQYAGRESDEDDTSTWKSYGVDGGELTEAEMSNSNKVATTRTDFGTKSPGSSAVSIFKKTLTWNNSVTSAMLDNNTAYTMKISNATITPQSFTLTYYCPNSAGGDIALHEVTQEYGTTVNLTSANAAGYAGSGKVFMGWYEYNASTRAYGDLLSTQGNYGFVMVKNLTIAAKYGTSAATGSNWSATIDDNEVTKELYSSSSGTFYNDTIVRFKKGVTAAEEVPTGSEVGVLIINDGGTNGTITASTTNLDTFAAGLVNGQTRAIGSAGKFVTKLSKTVSSGSLSYYNRFDFALRSDYTATTGSKYTVYAYVKLNGSSSYIWSTVASGSYS